MSEFNIELLKEQKKRAEDDDEQHNINSIISKLKTNIEQITDLFKNFITVINVIIIRIIKNLLQ